MQLLEKMKDANFAVQKKVDADAGLNVYDLKYNENRLFLLENIDEGEVTFAGKIKILRKYCVPKTADPSMYDYYTRVEDTSIAEKRGTLLCMHGFAQCSDVFMELAINMAMNGYVVFAIDLEGYGYSAGARVSGLAIEKFHHQCSTLLQLADKNLPAFLLGHSMGCLAVETYLNLNPELAKKLSGVILSAPFFGAA